MKTTVPNTTAGAKTSFPVINRSPHWRTRGRNLVELKETGVLYYRGKHGGKTIRRSLDTTKITIARDRLSDKRKQVIAELKAPAKEVIMFKDARLLYEADLERNSDLTEASKRYRLARLAALLKAWPGLDNMKLDKITKAQCEKWKKGFAAKWSVSNYNNSLSTLRAILARGGLKGESNPATHVKRLGVKPTLLQLPEPQQFERIVDAIECPGKYPEPGKKQSLRVAPQSKDCADLVRFLAFSGCRLSEAQQVQWQHVDFERGEIRVKNAKVRITSGHPEWRYVPIIPAMRQLLERLKCQNPHKPTDKVCILGECERSLSRACRINGIARITHHDLRHLFATRCIEAGVDIPTVSRWLGHVDGGALAMKVYGHLRREHSQSQAAKVTFGSAPLPDNAIPLKAVELEVTAR